MKNLVIKLLIISSLFACWACKVDNPSPYRQKWKAKTVKENNVVVYVEGGTNNIYPAYKNFRLNLSDTNLVVLNEFTGQAITGKWAIVGNGSGGKLLRLTQLLPEPAASGGVLEYVIKKEPSDEFILENSKPNPKTGNSKNEYVLVPDQ